MAHIVSSEPVLVPVRDRLFTGQLSSVTISFILATATLL
jgi:hypothetical protein